MKIKPHHIAVSIPVISIMFDIIIMHFASEGTMLPQLIRAATMFGIIGYLIYPKIKVNSVTASIILFLLYVLIIIVVRIPEPAELVLGIEWISKIAIGMLLVFVGYRHVNCEHRISRLNQNTFLAGVILVIYFLVVNIFEIGTSMYFQDETMFDEMSIIRTGMMGGVGMNTISYILLLAPLIYYSRKNAGRMSPLVYHIVFVSLLIILFLVLRRSAILIVIAGYAIYMINHQVLISSVKKSMIAVFIISLAVLPVFQPYIYSIYELRGDRVISTQAFEHDTRTGELRYMIDKTLQSNDISYILFGESFNTLGVYANAAVYRSLHSDISNLLYITGVIGLLLYLMIHLVIINYAFRFRKYAPGIYFTVLIVLVVASILLMYPGRLTGITYKSIMYIYVGSIIGLMYRNYINSKV